MTFGIYVTGIEATKRGLRFISDALDGKNPRRATLLKRIGAALRDRARGNISDQSYEGQSWRPLSDWTRAKTGRFKALITEREKIKYDVDAQGLTLRVFHEQTDPNWTLTQHHKGFTSPAVTGKLMAFPLVRPNLVGIGSKLAIFQSRKATKTPARPVWPSPAMIKKLVGPLIDLWMKENAKR